MPARIKYEDIKDMKPEQAYNYLLQLDKPVVKDMKMRELLNEATLNKPLIETYFRDLSPRGIYIFFDTNGNIRYIGQSNDSFYQRILTQLDTTYYAGYGWNSMLTIMGCKRLGKPHAELCEEDHCVDFDEAINYRLLMIDVGSDKDMNAATLKWLERILLKTVNGIDHAALLNGRIGDLNDDYWEFTIDEILNA